LTATVPIVMSSGSSQQSAPVAHSPLQVFPVGVRPYDARSQTPPIPEAEGTQTSPDAQSEEIEHDSPRSLTLGGGAASGTLPRGLLLPVADGAAASSTTTAPASRLAGSVVPLGAQLAAMQTRPLAQSAVRAHDSPCPLSTGAGDPLLLLQAPVGATIADTVASKAMPDSVDLARVFTVRLPRWGARGELRLPPRK
jgi:hypothetical protein